MSQVLHSGGEGGVGARQADSLTLSLHSSYSVPQQWPGTFREQGKRSETVENRREGSIIKVGPTK